MVDVVTRRPVPSSPAANAKTTRPRCITVTWLPRVNAPDATSSSRRAMVRSITLTAGLMSDGLLERDRHAARRLGQVAGVARNYEDRTLIGAGHRTRQSIDGLPYDDAALVRIGSGHLRKASQIDT